MGVPETSVRAWPAETQRHVGHKSFERSPHVRGPAAAHGWSRSNERLMLGLTNIEKILEIGYDFQRPESAHRDRHRIQIRPGVAAIGVVVQRLTPVVNALDAHAV